MPETAAPAPAHSARRRPSGPRIAAAALGALLAAGAAGAADLTFEPLGPWNGRRIYLSPARHADSGGRGECGHLGENDLAFSLAWNAANGDHYGDRYSPGSPWRNLRARGYRVRIGRGTASSAISGSNAWGADVHLPLHSNADVAGQCGRTDAARFGTVVIYWHASAGGPGLAAEVRRAVGTGGGATSPGTADSTCPNPGHPCTGITLGELRYTHAVAAYLEADFHTWSAGYAWLANSRVWGWRLGGAVDTFLGYPRLGGIAPSSGAAAVTASGAAAVTEASPLAAYPGFGHDPEADETRFECEEVERERRTAECMAAAGWDYRPQPPVAAAGLATPEEAAAWADVDPNRAYVERLSPAGRRDYHLALHGVEDPHAESADALADPADPLAGGCAGEALRAVPGVFAARNELREELLELERAIAGDPRVAGAERRWAACMTARGHAAETPAELLAAVDEAALAGAAEGGPAEVEALARLEAARPDAADCALQAGLPPALAEARAEHEELFVRRHRRMLDEHREQMKSAPERLP